MPTARLTRTAIAAALACAGMLLVGWTGLLVPSLIRSIEPAFEQTDAGIGVFFFVIAVASVGGSMAGGLLTERIGRRVVLPLAVTLIALGLIGMATVPTWGLFLALAIPFGFGSGAIDGGMNGLVLDLYPEGRGRALNLLHLFFSLGALASPLAIGRLVEAGAGWQAIIIGTALAAIPLAILFAVVAMPSGRHARSAGTATVRVGLSLPIIALAIAIACYVASEIGVSNWLVRFLETASIGLATSALALFWGCLALGRIVTAWLGDRFDHARFAATAALVAAIALVAAVARAIAAGVNRAVRSRRLRVRTGLPADHGRRRRPVPDAVGGGQRVPLGLGDLRRDHLPAADGLHLGRGRAHGRDDRRRDPVLRLRGCPVRSWSARISGSRRRHRTSLSAPVRG